MDREPEIVRILREEERQKNTQKHTRSSTEMKVTPKDDTPQATNDSILLFDTTPGHLHTLNPNHLETVYRTAFERCPVALLVLDTQQRIISWNPYTETFLQKSDKELYFQSVESLHSTDEWMKIKQHLDHPAGLQHHHKTKILLKNNQTVEVQVLSCVLKNNNGRNLGYLYIIKSICEPAHGEYRLDSVVQYADDAIYLLDLNCQYLLVNNQLLSRLGRTRDEVLGKTFHDFHSCEESKEFTQKLSWVFEHGIPLKDVHCKDDRWYFRTLNPVKDSFSAHTTSVLVISRDITENKKTEEMLLENEKKYRTMFDFFPQTTFLVDTTGKILDANQQMNDWIGYAPNEIQSTNLFHVPIFTKESKKSMKKIFSKRYLNKKISPFEIQILTKRGETRRGIVHTAPLRDENGTLLNYLITISDLLEQKDESPQKKIRTLSPPMKTLTESEKRFQVVLENSLDMIYQWDLQKKTCDYVSPSSSKIIGYSPEEMLTFTFETIEEMIHPEDLLRWYQQLKTITDQPQQQNAIQSFEYRFKHKTRGYRWMRDTSTAIFDETHQPISLIGTLEDITDRKKVWEELVKSEEKYRILAETSADGVFTTDSLGRLTYVNPSFERLCGRRKSQILATPFRNYLLEDSVYFFQQIFIDVRKKNDKIENVELELVASDGGITPIEANIAPLTKQAEFSGVVCTVRDITQRREIEDELKKNERLKTEFMNIAAHELRSPVTPIKGYLDLIIHDNESNEKIKNWAKISLRNAERLLKLVNDILDVSRLDSDTMRFDMEKIDLVEFLNEIVEDVKPAIMNKKLEFFINIPSPLPHIIGDKNRLSQVLKNLIGNSLKFTDCGSISLNVEKKDNHIQIAVIDTGIGISKDELRKIFTKFYQAYTGEDRNNEGTGLGLFISKEIIKKHNGEIWAESEIGKGSRFIIQLPFVYKMIVDFQK